MGNPCAPHYRATCDIFRYTRFERALFAPSSERLEVLLVEGEGSVQQVHVGIHRLSQHLLESVHLLLRARHQVLGNGLTVVHPLPELGGHVPEEALDEVRALLLERRGPLDDLPVGLQALGQGAVGALLASERLLHHVDVGLHGPGERPVGLRLALEHPGQALDPALGGLHVPLLGVHGALHYLPVGLAERLTQPLLRLGLLLFGHTAPSCSRYSLTDILPTRGARLPGPRGGQLVDHAVHSRKGRLMRAMVTPQFGGPDLFEEREVERPHPGPGEVLVRVVAAGTNPVDAKVRAAGGSRGLEAPMILGADVSGVVEEVGPGVTDLAPGDEVFYTPEVSGPDSNKAYAEYSAAAADIVAEKPASLTHEEAAAVPLAGGTAYEGIVRRLAIRVGETLLIHGGAGGVGSFAVQIAKASGARVLASAGSRNQETLKELGVDVAIDYTSEDVFEITLDDTGGEGVNAVLDTAGADLIVKSVQATRSFGRLAGIVSLQGDLTPAYRLNQTIYGVFLTRERRRLDEMTRLIERGQVRPLVDEVLPLNEVAKAHERLESGHGGGKVVLRVAEE